VSSHSLGLGATYLVKDVERIPRWESIVPYDSRDTACRKVRLLKDQKSYEAVASRRARLPDKVLELNEETLPTPDPRPRSHRMSNLQEVQISASCRPGSRPCARRCVFAVGWLWFSRSLGLRYRRWCNETNKTKTHEGDLKRQLCGLVKQKQKTEVGSIEASRWKRKDAQIAKGNSLIKLRDTQMMTLSKVQSQGRKKIKYIQARLQKKLDQTINGGVLSSTMPKAQERSKLHSENSCRVLALKMRELHQRPLHSSQYEMPCGWRRRHDTAQRLYTAAAPAAQLVGLQELKGGAVKKAGGVAP
ncbi:hypothetical protein THAOC_28696, partial [Thalassiosira oceanica]